ncbi:pilin [Patescibacteria group bacterium]|nr:pilin [Patescibacteria group bacterium]
MNKIKLVFIGLIIIFGVLAPQFVFNGSEGTIAQGITDTMGKKEVKYPPLTLQVPLGDIETLKFPYLTDYLEALFTYFVGVTAILAAIFIMWGGYKWIFASGNQSVLTSAKQTILNAMIGLILALTSYLLLRTLNPRIVALEFPEIRTPKDFALSAVCGDGEVKIMDGGECKEADDIPPLILCRAYDPYGPDQIVYGHLKFCSAPEQKNCGEFFMDSCKPVAEGNCSYAYCDDHQACTIHMDGSTNGYMMCKNSIRVSDAALKNFPWGNEFIGIEREGFWAGVKWKDCGTLWVKTGAIGEEDGYVGTHCYNKGSCVMIDNIPATVWEYDVWDRNDFPRVEYGYLGKVPAQCMYGNEDVGLGSFLRVSGGAAPPTCNTAYLVQLATDNGTAYTYGDDPQLLALISHVKSLVPAASGVTTATYDQTHESCNYSRGASNSCDTSCSHSLNSCHYGGGTGSIGAQAVDWAAIQSLGDEIIDAACSWIGPGGETVKRNTCEKSDGTAVACSSSDATHVHQSISTCDRDAYLGC